MRPAAGASIPAALRCARPTACPEGGRALPRTLELPAISRATRPFLSEDCCSFHSCLEKAPTASAPAAAGSLGPRHRGRQGAAKGCSHGTDPASQQHSCSHPFLYVPGTLPSTHTRTPRGAHLAPPNYTGNCNLALLLPQCSLRSQAKTSPVNERSVAGALGWGHQNSSRTSLQQMSRSGAQSCLAAVSSTGAAAATKSVPQDRCDLFDSTC
jgi:hypothetical protein